MTLDRARMSPGRSAIAACFARADYQALQRLARRQDPARLRAWWPRLEPLQRAALFKLMEPGRALDFYRTLSRGQKYFLLGAFSKGSIAPLLENASPKTRALFHRLPDSVYDEMLRP